MLESVQERAVRMCSGLTNGSYEDKLRQLGLDRLETRRKKADLIQTWKIIHAHDKVDESLLFERMQNRAQRITRATASEYNLKRKTCRIDQRKKFFTQRIISDWNSLPEVIKSSHKIGLFKHRLNEHFKST